MRFVWVERSVKGDVAVGGWLLMRHKNALVTFLESWMRFYCWSRVWSNCKCLKNQTQYMGNSYLSEAWPLQMASRKLAYVNKDSLSKHFCVHKTVSVLRSQETVA